MPLDENFRAIEDATKFVVEGGVELTEWQIEWLKTLWSRKPYPERGLMYIPVRNHGRTAMMKFIDEWTKNWEKL